MAPVFNVEDILYLSDDCFINRPMMRKIQSDIRINMFFMLYSVLWWVGCQTIWPPEQRTQPAAWNALHTPGQGLPIGDPLWVCIAAMMILSVEISHFRLMSVWIAATLCECSSQVSTDNRAISVFPSSMTNAFVNKGSRISVDRMSSKNLVNCNQSRV